MANYPLILTMLDAYGRNTKRSFIVTAADVAAAQVVVATFVVAYQDISMLKIVDSRLVLKSTYSGSPTANANKDEGATFSVLLTTPGKKASIQVPGPALAIRNADGTIDLTNEDVVTFAAVFTDGDVLVSDGEIVSQFLKGTLDK